jgi:ATP-dependent protease HslVU (ClpYQ) peptidase subunit
MTVVCAVKDGPDVWIGSDSRMLAGSFLYQMPVGKWLAADGWRIGISGSYRFASLLTHRPPALGVTAFDAAEALRALIVADGWQPLQDQKEGPVRHDIGMILVSPEHEVYELGTAGIPVDQGNEFTAIGSGYEYALGAAHARRLERPEARVRIAIDAAIKYDVSCGGAPYVERIGSPEVERLVPRLVRSGGVAD